jgi:hypothetical protein
MKSNVIKKKRLLLGFCWCSSHNRVPDSISKIHHNVSANKGPKNYKDKELIRFFSELLNSDVEILPLETQILKHVPGLTLIFEGAIRVKYISYASLYRYAFYES